MYPSAYRKARRPGLAHGLSGRGHQLQPSPCRAHEDRRQHRRRGGRRPRALRRAKQRRRQSVPLPLRAHRRRRYRQFTNADVAQLGVPAEGRPCGVTISGALAVAGVGTGDWTSAPRAISDCRHRRDARDVSRPSTASSASCRCPQSAGGDTTAARHRSEGFDSAVVNTRGIFDEKGRLMVLMTHNTDISERGNVKERTSYFYSLLTGRVRDRHQRDALRDDPLEHIEPELRGSCACPQS